MIRYLFFIAAVGGAFIADHSDFTAGLTISMIGALCLILLP